MRQLLIIILLLLINSDIFGQLSELRLFPDFIIYNGDTLSCYDKNGLKQGKWIEYEIKEILLVPTPDSCNVDSISPNGKIYIKENWKYVPESYSRLKSKKDSNCDTAYSNVIPPIVIEFLSFGEYDDNKKIGKWKTYDKNELLNKVFEYLNGLPVDKFYFYYQNGLIKMEGLINRNDNSFKIKKFSETGDLIEEKKHELKDLNKLL